MGVEQWLTVNGPWALCGMLLFILWDGWRRQDRGAAESIRLMNEVLRSVSADVRENAAMIRQLCTEMARQTGRRESLSKGQQDERLG